MDALRWTLSEALAATEAPAAELGRHVGCARGVPAVVVDGSKSTDSAGADEAARAAARLAGLPAVTIASGMTAAEADGFDVQSDDPEPLVSAVLAQPTAAVVAAQVLRASERLSTADGLIAESLAYATLQGGPEHQAWLAGRGRKVRNDLDRPRLHLVDRPDGSSGPLELVLDRPRLHNLMDAAMRDQLADALRAVAAVDPPRALLWRANGPSFCAGGDPAEFGSAADPAAAHMIRSSANPAPLLAAIADRVSVIVDGPAVGAGIELAAFCAEITAGPEARFALPELAMGLVPGAGGTVSIPRRIGRQRTLQWLLLGSEIDPATALSWGLVDRLS